MPNNYFQFKQFTIWQQYNAMKVCTDSCLFGASLPLNDANNNTIKNVLDIGAGTGLLSLMYAQLNENASITAIEIEKQAADEAIKNVSESVFNKQINVLTQNLLQWQANTNFDLIITNPPFYENEWLSNNTLKNTAHHSVALPMQLLLQKIKTLMQPNTICAILLPTKRLQAIRQLFKKINLHIVYTFTVYANEKKNDFRTILFLQLNTTKEQYQKEIIIKLDNEYTTDFKSLLKNFYLHL